jgi:hypothetical protein
MSEETEQPTGQAEVTTNNDGTPEVSANELLEAIGFNDEVEKETKPEPEKQPEKEVPAEPQKRKIKWQGQEVEVEPDKEIELIQKGYDYTQKMQQLAAERELITPHIGVIKAMQQDPALRQKIAEHFTGGTPKQETKTFDDPIEQLKWETRQEVMKEVEEKFVKPLQFHQTQMTHQQALNQVRMQVQADPLFKDVQAEIIKEVESLPPSVRKSVYLQYDQDPTAYMEVYQMKRQKLASNKTTTQASMPEPTRKTERAPILESAKSAPTESELKSHNDNLKALNKRARAGDLHALGELLLKGDMMKGIID